MAKSSRRLAYAPALFDKADIYAVQALMAGVASKDQQIRGMAWIIKNAAATHEISYRPGEDGRRDTDFAEGRRWVGLQILNLSKLDPEKQG